MSDAAAPAGVAAPVKNAKIAKPKMLSAHPTFGEMIAKAIVGLAGKKGSSKVAIKKYILANFSVVDNKMTNSSLNLALKKGVVGGKLVTAKGHSGTFKAAKPTKAEMKSKAISPKKAVKKAVIEPAIKKTPKKAVGKPVKAASAKKVAVKPKKIPVKKVWVWLPSKAAKPKAVKKAPTKKSAAMKSLAKRAPKKAALQK
jgi:histone H1/5